MTYRTYTSHTGGKKKKVVSRSLTLEQAKADCAKYNGAITYNSVRSAKQNKVMGFEEEE